MAEHVILYIDDDPDDVLLFKEAFKNKAEFEVIEGSNGLHALQILEDLCSSQKSSGLIVMDINLPILDGRKTLIRLRTTEKYKEILSLFYFLLFKEIQPTL